MDENTYLNPETEPAKAGPEPEPAAEEPAPEHPAPEAEQTKRKAKKSGSSRGIAVFAAILGAVILCGITFFATYTLTNQLHEAETAEWKTRLARFSKLEAFLDAIESSYAGDADESELMDAAYHALFSELDDYSCYMTREEYGEFSSSRTGYAGIGVSVTLDPETEGMYIYRVIPGSPAEKAGLKTGMIIVGVEDIEVDRTTYRDAVNAVGGDEGTPVALKIRDGENTRSVSVVRGHVESKSVWYTDLGNGLSLIEIDEFTASKTADQFREALEQAVSDGSRGIIFDVRGNPGGDLNVITSVLDMLLPEGPIVNIVVNGEVQRTISSGAAQTVTLPMAVLCDGGTASAAELFTADLRDYELATIVGETTFGKGTVQTVTRFRDGSAYKMTTSLYTPACGEGYNGVGIAPDVEASLPDGTNVNRFLLSREEDLPLQEAIKILLGGQS
ncbi:MAG: PDZ domain-containing protein [Clostridia bacterium]|nr:PDZ domain-containing protein [Clostridia bacterium]